MIAEAGSATRFCAAPVRTLVCTNIPGRSLPSGFGTAVLIPAIEKAVKDPEFVKFANERNTRWEYIAPADVNPMFDKRRAVVRDIMSKAGILKEAK